MNKLSRNNLQEFCRVCLTYLPKRRRVLRNNSGDSNQAGYDLNLLPQLREIYVLITSMKVSKENEAVFPRRLCQSCYDKMVGLEDFHNLAINSTEAIYKIVHDDNINYEVERVSQQTRSVKKFKKKQIMARSSQGRDNALLLPELVPLPKNSIKAEPPDYKVDKTKSGITPPKDRSVKLSKTFVKNEIASEGEEDKDPPFNEGNALAIPYNSISDDSEVLITVGGNGDVNTSNLQKENETDNADDNQRPRTQKRDRNKKMLKCPFCAHEAYQQVYLDAHIRGVHIGHEKPFLCAECQITFKSYDKLRLHRIKSKHFIEQTFICGINGCDASFKLIKTLEAHRKVEHSPSALVGFEKMLEYQQWQLNEKGKRQWVCQLCLKDCSTKYELFIHQRRHAEMKSHICKVCGIGKATKKELLTHMRTHPVVEKVKCSLCPQEFNHKNTIYRHMHIVHEGQRRYPCSYCSKRFSTRQTQICHERLHTGERPYTCNICNKGFARKENLKSHMKNHDKKLRTHICSICSQRFITKKHLSDHEERHNGAKPHICNICNRGFYSAADLNVHKQSHTEEEIRDEIKRGDLEVSQQHVHDNDKQQIGEKRDESSNDRSSSMSIN